MKNTAAALAALLLMFCLSACGAGAGPASSSLPDSSTVDEPLKLETLRLELTRREGLSADMLMYAVQALPQALKTALANHGVEADMVEVTVGASPASTAQALEEGGIDLAILPGKAFVEAGGSAVPLLTALERNGLPDSTDPARWADGPSDGDDTPSGGLRYLILAGPSEYGRQLANRTASDTPLTWDELDRAAWFLAPNETSMTGLWLADHYEGNTLSDLSKVSVGTSSSESGHDLLRTLATGDADVVVIPADVRPELTSFWQEELQRPGGIFDETTVIGVTEKCYTTILAARPGDECLNGDAFRSALAAAMEELSRVQGDVTGALGGVFSAPVSSDDLNGMRRLVTLGG
ncbi:PhnD/SsuA/transferrin family substrate-binding protein [Oscillibacter sp.]|uniref:PhnD/SsuA/transferrin family substrate-binding protein n=1 Tax=Oscillibacter sp. TaxID=1945593 RepID=UPI0028A7EDA0|nr:PhnD/SsuA/transferrin family substrate-binding protein [Oscillibacter sp.]